MASSELPSALEQYPVSTELVYWLLKHHGESSIEELKAVTSVSHTTIRRSLRRLESEGLVGRRPDLQYPSRDRWHLRSDTEPEL